MGAKGQDGVAGLPGEKVCSYVLVCKLSHGKCSLCQWLFCNCEQKWEDKALLLENEALLPALPWCCNTLKKLLRPVILSTDVLALCWVCLFVCFQEGMRGGGCTEPKEATCSTVQFVVCKCRKVSYALNSPLGRAWM